jgi:hypothetical protein
MGVLRQVAEAEAEIILVARVDQVEMVIVMVLVEQVVVVDL